MNTNYSLCRIGRENTIEPCGQLKPPKKLHISYILNNMLLARISHRFERLWNKAFQAEAVVHYCEV